jgi:hypothetical protein
LSIELLANDFVKEHSKATIIVYLSSYFSQDIPTNEQMTRVQTLSSESINQQKCRITASVAHEVLHTSIVT